MEQRTLLYGNLISREEIENIVRQRHPRLLVSTGGNEGQALWTSRQDNGGGGRSRNNRKSRNSNNSSNSTDSSNSGNSSNGNNRQQQ